MSILAAQCLVSHKENRLSGLAGRARPGPRSNPERDSQAKNAATGTVRKGLPGGAFVDVLAASRASATTGHHLVGNGGEVQMSARSSL